MLKLIGLEIKEFIKFIFKPCKNILKWIAFIILEFLELLGEFFIWVLRIAGMILKLFFKIILWSLYAILVVITFGAILGDD